MWRPRPVDSIIIGAAGGRVNIFIHFQPIFGPRQGKPGPEFFGLGRIVEAVLCKVSEQNVQKHQIQILTFLKSPLFSFSLLSLGRLSSELLKHDFTFPAAAM